MKSLLLKDLYILTGQMKFFLIAMVIFALMPENNFVAISFLYAAMLPISIMAYDEKTKWDRYVDTLPLKPIQIVMSKYVPVYLFSASVLIISSAGRFLIATLSEQAFSFQQLSVLLPYCLIALIIAPILLPIIYYTGVEKGRLLFMLIGVGIYVLAFIVGELGFLQNIPFLNQPTNMTNILLGTILVLINILSIAVSTMVYRKKHCG